MKCHSTGCLDWPLTARLYIFLSPLCIYYRIQMAKNNTLRHVIYSFWLHFIAQKLHRDSAHFNQGGTIRVNGNDTGRAATQPIFARQRSILSPSFSPQPRSVPLLQLECLRDWKSSSQLDLPPVGRDPKRQNKPSSSLFTRLPSSSATCWNWQSDLDEGNGNCQSLISRTFYTFT